MSHLNDDLPNIPTIDDDSHQSINQSEHSNYPNHHRSSNSPLGMSMGQSDHHNHSVNQSISHHNRHVHDQLMYMPSYNQPINQSMNQPISHSMSHPMNQSINQPNQSYMQQTFNQASSYHNQPHNHQYNPLPVQYGNYPPIHQSINQSMNPSMNQSVNQLHYPQLHSHPSVPYLSPPPLETSSTSMKRKAQLSISQSTNQSTSHKKSKKSHSVKSKTSLPPCVSLVQMQRKLSPRMSMSDLIDAQITCAFVDMQAANYDILSNIDECDGNVDVKMFEDRVVATVNDRESTIWDEFRVIEVVLKKEPGNEKKMQKLYSKLVKRAAAGEAVVDESTIPSHSTSPSDLPSLIYVAGEQHRRTSGARARPLHTIKWPSTFTDLNAANLLALTSASQHDGQVISCRLDGSGCVRIQVDKSDVSIEYFVTQVELDASVVAGSECSRLFKHIKSGKGAVEYEYDTEEEDEEFDSQEEGSEDYASED